LSYFLKQLLKTMKNIFLRYPSSQFVAAALVTAAGSLPRGRLQPMRRRPQRPGGQKHGLPFKGYVVPWTPMP